MPSISIIVPIYNAEKYLNHCIKQIINQTKIPDEIIFIDDNSTDRTYLQCLEIKNTSNLNIKIIKSNTNFGPGLSRNIGIKNSTCDYMIFIDVDDELDKDFIKKLYENITQYKTDIAICGIIVKEENKTKIYKPSDYKNSCDLMKEKILLYSSFNKIFKSSFLKYNNIYFPDCRVGEDVVFSFMYCSLLPSISSLSDPLYIYNRHTGSITKSLFLRREIFKALDILLIYWEQNSTKIHKYSLCFNVFLLHGVYYPFRLILCNLINKKINFFFFCKELFYYIKHTFFLTLKYFKMFL